VSSLLNVPFTGTIQDRQYLILKNARIFVTNKSKNQILFWKQKPVRIFFQIHPVSCLKRNTSVHCKTRRLFLIYTRHRQSSLQIILKTVYIELKISAHIAIMARITISVFVCVVGIMCCAGTRNMTHFLREPVVCEELSDLLNPVRLPINDTLKVFYLEQCLEVCLWDTTCKVATFVKDLTCRTYSEPLTCQELYSDEVQTYAKMNEVNVFFKVYQQTVLNNLTNVMNI